MTGDEAHHGSKRSAAQKPSGRKQWLGLGEYAPIDLVDDNKNAGR